MDFITQRLDINNLELPDWAKKAIKRHKKKGEEIQVIRKGLVPEDVQFKEGERSSVDYITTKSVDRDGEIIVPSGAVLDHYRKHPVVLFAHDYKSMPVGKSIWIKPDEKGLIAKTQYANTEKAEEIFNYRKDGFPLAKSIGFVPLDVVEEKDFEKLDLKSLGLNEEDLTGAKRVYPKWLMLEYSDVPVPSNPDALQLAISKGLCTEDNLKDNNAVVIIDINEDEVDTKDVDEEGDVYEKAEDLVEEVDEVDEVDDDTHIEPSFISKCCHSLVEGQSKAFPDDDENTGEFYLEYTCTGCGNIAELYRSECCDALVVFKTATDEEGNDVNVYICTKCNTWCDLKDDTEIEIVETEKEIVLKPETTDNYHHIPVQSSDKFVSDSMRTIDISKDQGIKAVIGKLKTDPGGSTKVQKYMFDVKKWTMENAQRWVKDHKKDIEGMIKGYGSRTLQTDTRNVWDANAATKRMRQHAGGPDKEKVNWTKYAMGFAWHDTKDRENFGSYKLPFVDVVDDSLKATWGGVHNAMAALMGARTPIDIPEGDRKTVYGLLSSYYKKFDKEPPEYKEYEEEQLKEIFPEKAPEIVKQTTSCVCPNCNITVTIDDEVACEETKCEECGGLLRAQKQIDKQTYECECIECNWKTVSKDGQHCREMKCEKCGGPMRRLNRPGPGKELDIEFVDTDIDVEDILINRPVKDMRWNRKWSKVFDVTAVELQPSSSLYKLYSDYLDCKVKDIFVLKTSFSGVMLGNKLAAVKALLDDVDVKDIRNFGYNGTENPPHYEDIRINSTHKDYFLTEGNMFCEAEWGRFCLSFSPTWTGIRLIIFSTFGDKEYARKFIDDVDVWVDKNNMLKGEKFSLGGEFIDGTDEKWSSVILAPKVKDAIKRSVNTLQRHGKETPNRGILMAGPAGTGKTMSGRVVMNSSDATFIWVSSRDFHMAGSIGGLTFAFDLARKLAPTVLFVEDIDHWLSNKTVDLVKTEMDGIKTSKGLLTVLTSNYPELLPDALIDRPGRFHEVLNFDLPDEVIRRQMLNEWVGELEEEDLQRFVEDTSGFSGAHLRELVNYARSLANEESLELSDALNLSLNKIDEQRRLINELRGKESNEDIIHSLTGDLEFANRQTEHLFSELKAVKEGRVLSRKNRTIIKDAVEGMAKATEALNELMDATEREKPVEASLPVDDTFGDKTVEEPVLQIVEKDVTSEDEYFELEELVIPESIQSAMKNVVIDVLKDGLTFNGEELGELVKERVLKAKGKVFL